MGPKRAHRRAEDETKKGACIDFQAITKVVLTAHPALQGSVLFA